MKPVGKPDAGNRHVRFDERGRETGLTPPRLSSTLLDNLADLDLAQNQEPVVAGEVLIDLYRRTVTSCGEPVHLTPKEFAVLAELARNAGRVLTHRFLLRAVWGPAHEDHVDYLRVAVSALRRKLGGQIILNEPGVGYRLAVQSAQ